MPGGLGKGFSGAETRPTGGAARPSRPAGHALRSRANPSVIFSTAGQQVVSRALPPAAAPASALPAAAQRPVPGLTPTQPSDDPNRGGRPRPEVIRSHT